MRFLMMALAASFLSSSFASAATPQCHPGYYGICRDARSYPHFAWYRTVTNLVECFAIDAAPGSWPDDQANCSPSGFAWYLAQDGYNHCYSIDAPEGAAEAPDSYCR